MPSGYLTLVAIIALYTAGVLWPPRRPKALARAVFILSHPINELPFVGLAALLAGTVVALIGGDLASTAGVVLLAAAAVTALGLLEVARQGWLAGPVVQRSLHRDLGSEWHSVNRVATRSRSRHLIRAVLAPLPVRPRNVQRIRDVAYGQAGRSQRLDVYRRRGPTSGEAPVLIHFHGGHFRIGAKSREALPLLHRLAGEGWVCISANYRLGSAGPFPNSLIDAKAVIVWVAPTCREVRRGPVGDYRGRRLGRRPPGLDGSTDGQRAAFQPDGEHANTSVAGAVCLYGYYGDRAADRGMASFPAAYVGRDAPPFRSRTAITTLRSQSAMPTEFQGAAAHRLDQPRGLPPAPRRPASLRPVPIPALRPGRRRDRDVCHMGARPPPGHPGTFRARRRLLRR